MATGDRNPGDAIDDRARQHQAGQVGSMTRAKRAAGPRHTVCRAGRRRAGWWRRARLAGGAVIVTLAVAACGAGGVASGAAGTVAPKAIASGRAPANGRFALLNGRQTSFRAFTDRPLMVWFVANGCASCAASIPTVAQHLSAFAAKKVRVLVLGIYGAFGRGSQAGTQLADFGRAAAGQRFSSPVWTWGVASAGLTSTFDPSGAPDEYFLLNRAGRAVYQGSTPVSTIGTLLSHLKEIA